MADVAGDAAKGSVAGSALGPWGAAAGGIIGGLGSLFAGSQQSEQLQRAAQAANGYLQQGVGKLQGVSDQAATRANPYLAAGQTGINGATQALQNGPSGTQPALSGAFNFDAWKDPSTNYSISESNAGLQAAGLAGGATGGGMAKALQANGNQLAQQAYGNAYQRYLAQNQQDFGQQQTRYGNAASVWQNQLGGYQNMAGMGNTAQQNLSGTQLGAANSMAGLYGNMSSNLMGNGANLAMVSGAMGGGASQGLTQLAGVYDMPKPTTPAVR